MVKGNILSWDSVEVYLGSIGMISDVDIQRVKDIFLQGRVLCPEELETMFISNYEEPDGKKQFKDLWLFSDKYLIESLNFSKVETPKLEMTIFSNSIHSVSFETNNFNLKKAKDNSKLHIVFYTLTSFSCDQIASGSNCDAMMSIYNKYVKPNLSSGQSTELL